MLYIDCEQGGHVSLPLSANLNYDKKYNPGGYVDLVEKFPEEAAKLGHFIPAEARTLEDIFQEVGCHKFRVMNVITLNSYLIAGGIHYGTCPLEGIIFWNAVYIHNNHKTYARGSKRMFILLSSKEEIEEFKREGNNSLSNEIKTICT